MTAKRRAALDAMAAAMRAENAARRAGPAPPGADGWLAVLLLRRELMAADRTIGLLRLEVGLLRAQLPEARKRTGG